MVIGAQVSGTESVFRRRRIGGGNGWGVSPSQSGGPEEEETAWWIEMIFLWILREQHP